MSTESNIYALWAAKQTAKGTVATTATKRLQQVGGNIDIMREDGSENYSDLDRFGDEVDFINTLQGGGSPVIHAQPNATAYLLWLFCGGETFTAKSVGVSAPKFVFTPQTNTGFWLTLWKRMGLTDIIRQRYADCKITSIKIEGSTGSKVVKITPTIVSLDPGEKIAADPVVALEVAEPFLWTDATGTITIDSTIFRATTQFSITLDAGLAPWQGDSVKFYDLVAANASVTMEGPTLLLDSASLAQYNLIMYGNASPANGDKPLATRPSVGTFTAEYVRGATDLRESLKIELPGVKWSPDLAVAPNPDGGATEIALNGSMRKVVGQPAFRITVETGGTGGDIAAHSA